MMRFKQFLGEQEQINFVDFLRKNCKKACQDAIVEVS